MQHHEVQVAWTSRGSLPAATAPSVSANAEGLLRAHMYVPPVVASN